MHKARKEGSLVLTSRRWTHWSQGAVEQGQGGQDTEMVAVGLLRGPMQHLYARVGRHPACGQARRRPASRPLMPRPKPKRCPGVLAPGALQRANLSLFLPRERRAMSIDGAESQEDEHELSFYALRHPASVTLRELYQFGESSTNSSRTLLLAAQFLHEELPVRLARRARELRKLPFGLGDTTSIKGVRKLYERSFFRIRRFPKPTHPELEERFTEMLEDIKNEHSSVQANIARGLQELSEERTDLQRERGSSILLAQGMPFDFGQFLDRFYLSRVGVRVLMGQHIMLHHPQDGFVGVIQKRCQPSLVCQHAIEDAQRICEMQYGTCPEVIVEGQTDMTLPYIPEHLHYIFFELLKNSCRAVTERFGNDPGKMEPIHVVFAEGDEDVAIKISDKGGGIPRSGMERLWTYTFTTAGNTKEKLNQLNAGGGARQIMAGFAHGLPLSRIHARAFGGDLHVMPIQGHGTDVYVHICKLGNREVPVP